MRAQFEPPEIGAPVGRTRSDRDQSRPALPGTHAFNRRALLLNGLVNNLEYGSNAPDAPKDVFIDDAEFARRWNTEGRHYLVAEGPARPRLEKLVGAPALHIVAASGGKYLFTNRQRPGAGGKVSCVH